MPSQESFPRGGTLSLNPLEFRDVIEQVTLDTLPAKTGKRPSKESSVAQKKQRVEEPETKAPVVESITFKKLCAGQVLLGAVREITDIDLVVSLPNQLTGYVSITEVSAQLTAIIEAAALDEDDEVEIPSLLSLFVVGQLVPVIITEITNDKDKKRIELSMNPTYINKRITREHLVLGLSLSASVVSEEDHGYVLDSGIKDTQFFLPSTSVKFAPGQILQCTIAQLDSESRNCKVSLRSETDCINAESVLMIDALVPGSIVHCQVEHVTERGINVLVHSLFEASIGIHHLNNQIPSTYRLKQKLTATIIYVDFDSKKIGLSLNKNIKQFEKISFNQDIGSIHRVMIKHVDSNIGLIASFENGLEGYIHITKASDKPIKRFDECYEIGKIHNARIISVDNLDGLYILSLQKSILEQQFLRHHEVKIGMMVDAVVLKVDVSGVIVSIGENMSALIPNTHLSDIILSNPGKKYSVGSKVKAQVLNVDIEKKRVILSCKKSLLQSQNAIISEYSEENVGVIASGTIKKVESFGVILSFYGNVQAICLPSDTGSSSEDWKSEFKTSQVVACRILSVNTVDRKMRVSFKLRGREDFENIVTGSLHKATVITKESDNIVVQLTQLNMMAILPKSHLSDYPSICEKKFKKLTKGTELEVAIIETDLKNVKVFVTIKQALLASRQSLSESDLKVGSTFAGYVNKISDTFCTVKTICGDKLLVLKKNVSDEFTSSISESISIGQTIIGTVIVIHEDLRMEASMRASTNLAEIMPFETQYLQNYIIERNAFISTEVKPEFQIGSIVKGTVSQVLPRAVILSLGNGYKGLLTFTKNGASMHSVGDVIDARILEIDIAKKIADLTTNTSVQIKEHDLSDCIGTTFESTIELIKEDYMIVTIPSLGNMLAMVCGKSFNNVSQSLFTNFNVGKLISIVLLKTVSDIFSMPLFAYRAVEAVVIPKKTSPSKNTKPTKPVKLNDFANCIDPNVKSFSDIQDGNIIQVKIKSKKELQINVIIADNVFGRIHVSQVQFTEKVKNSEELFSKFKAGEIISVKVIGFHCSKTHKYLPLSNRQDGNKKNVMVELSTYLGAEENKIKSYEDVTLNERYSGFVGKIEKSVFWILLSNNILGRVFYLDASHSINVVSNIAQHFKIGDYVECIASKIDTSKNAVDLSIKEASAEIKTGMTTCGKVSSVKPESGLIIQLTAQKYGRLHLTDISDTFTGNPTNAFIPGQLVKCHILNTDSSKIDVSTRESDFNQTLLAKDASIKDITLLKVGQKTKGFVKSISDNGCFVSISRSITARIKIAELSDTFVKDFKSMFTIGQLVSGTIIGVNNDTGRVELSLKSTSSNTTSDVLSIHSLQKGQLVKGTVRKVEKYGVFIKIENSSLSGLCHISELATVEPKEPSDLYNVGDSVLARVLLVDIEKKRINFSLKVDATEASLVPANVVVEEDAMSVDGDEDSEMSEAPVLATPLDIDEFNWNDNESTHPESQSDSEEDETSTPKKKSKRSKESEKKNKEKLISATEKAMVTGDMNPEQREDFERLILGTPNSSYIWIKYMAFQLQMTEIDKAREIAERAIKQISFREEQEKMNIWIAYLNLENTYGTEVSLKRVFERALIMNDQKKIYMQMTNIFELSKNKVACEEVYQSLIKKFSKSCKVWCAYAQFAMKNTNSEAFRAIMKRALLCLPKLKHVKTIIKFAQMEYKNGDSERARTIFEGVLSNYPKRVDIWNIFIDMEIKSNKKELVRRLFDRVINMKFSSKKMKFFFKKYLDFEKVYGDEGGIENVKRAAQAYVLKMQE